jgi:hypothetical protein
MNVWQHRGLIEQIVHTHSDYVPAQITEAARQQLIDELVDAAGFALAGLSGVVRGRRARPAAWTLDILFRDVSDTLARVGGVSTMNPDPSLSHAQSMVKEIAEKIGLPGHGKRGVGNLFTQAQRSRDIERTKHPNALLEYTPATNEIVVTIGGPAAPWAKQRRRC